MASIEETIDATLHANGHLQLSHQPQLPPGPVQVTIRAKPTTGTKHGLAAIAQQIAVDQRARGFPGRSSAEIQADEEASIEADAERDAELDAARRGEAPGTP
jgi:hypothetical protein